ncbi:acetylglutamate kinase [Ignatzschineria cameli]|uniref:Acetylglutamate kinase n=1 Tax=Ignatzschineria cameli TaxID=2182793 RepID=A0A2U2AKY3_9GAMM|nr:acetylglutamate kinase [Ignatzschineria cameli]PWD83827.1 acetylglutamate kinase [Ignatzschineria cameli]PWD88398.1 acetylglutamate kinase [Ignatzschineria cameli]PWD88898.1 acetylglutamate kinase [Ignatzschineria cameli]PWD89615.1 acetylglutamate kinase [Ignatzschineria cameli]
MITNHDKAHILVEALPFIRKYADKTVVIKYGGAAMVDEKVRDEFMKDIVLMKYVGLRPIIIHGGGPEINAMLKRVNKESRFVEGNRVSDAETVEIAEMVLSAKINKGIVADLNRLGAKAVGLSGKDGGMLTARKKYIEKEGGMIDIGFVGEIESVDRSLIDILVEQDYIPVISSIGIGPSGETFNINADYVAGEVAAAVEAYRLIFLTDVNGVYRDFEDKSSLIADMSVSTAKSYIDNGIISGGMIPKVNTCLAAIERGVHHVIILNGQIRHSILLELFTEEGCGTMIYKD